MFAKRGQVLGRKFFQKIFKKTLDKFLKVWYNKNLAAGRASASRPTPPGVSKKFRRQQLLQVCHFQETTTPPGVSPHKQKTNTFCSRVQVFVLIRFLGSEKVEKYQVYLFPQASQTFVWWRVERPATAVATSYKTNYIRRRIL